MQKTIEQRRNYKIVNLRALAIIIIMLGHSMIIFDPNWAIYSSTNESSFYFFIKRIINIIQMPLFFSLSGFLFFMSLNKDKYNNIYSLSHDKFKRLIIPYFSICLLWMIPIRYLAHYSNYIGKSIINVVFANTFLVHDIGHLWFLPCLFLIFLVVFILKDKIKNSIAKLIIFLFFSLASFAIPFGVFGLKTAMQYCFWFYLGFIINQYQSFLLNRKKMLISLSAICCILFFIIKELFINNKIINIPITMICAFSFIILLYIIVPNKTNKVVEFIDKNSYGLYLFHSPILYVFYYYYANINPNILVLLNFVIGGGIALCMILFVRKVKLDFVIGEYKKK